MRFAWNDVRARFVARNTNGVLMQNLRPESERIFSSGKEEDAGILSYFKDDDTGGGEIRPPRAHFNLIALTILFFAANVNIFLKKIKKNFSSFLSSENKQMKIGKRKNSLADFWWSLGDSNP